MIQDLLQELPNGYCPSSCEVEEEMSVFHREMSEYLTQQDVFLQEVKQDIAQINANLDPRNDILHSGNVYVCEV